MAYLFSLILTPIFLGITWVVYFIYFAPPPPMPNIDYNAWWGPEELRGKQDISIRPFTIDFDDAVVQDLKTRLKNTRPLTPPLDGVAFRYGFNNNELQSYLKYWAENYNFTERAKYLNKYPHFVTNIQGLDIHFMRVKPKVKPGVEVLPVLMLHGWPGSVREFYDAIPHLTSVSNDRDYALEIIAPSMPGFAFSQGTSKPGFGPPETAVLFRNFMRRLGYKKYYIQGGDWGSVTCNVMATFFPEEVLGYHSNAPALTTAKVPLIFGLFSLFPTLLMDANVVDRVYPLSKIMSDYIEETGYFHLQSTKPDSVGVAMTNSPEGLLAYVLEKFSVGTNRAYRNLQDGGLPRHFTKDQLLDNLMIYWMKDCFTTSSRFYAEAMSLRVYNMGIDDIPTEVPTWCLQAKHEIFYFPPSMLRLKYKNLLGATVFHEGGHFLAFELPEKFSSDVVKAMGEFRRFHKDRRSRKAEL